MADIPNLLLGQPEIGELLGRALDLKGLAPEALDYRVQAAIMAEDLTRPEYAWSRRSLRWHFGGFQAAVAAQFSMVVLSISSPAARAAIGIVERITISNINAAATAFRFGIGTAALPALGTSGRPQDDRQDDNNASYFRVGSLAQAASYLGSGVGLVQLAAGATLDLPLTGYVLSGKVASTGGNVMGFAVQTDVVNQGLIATIYWRERTALQSEL